MLNMLTLSSEHITFRFFRSSTPCNPEIEELVEDAPSYLGHSLNAGKTFLISRK